jgi:hypothetical protein
MRKLFIEALCEREIVCEEAIRREAAERIGPGDAGRKEQKLREMSDILIDLYFARHFNWEEIENHINLARKLDAFQTLTRVVSTERATWQEIKRAVKDFCAIPQGSLYISPEVAEVRVKLRPGSSRPAPFIRWPSISPSATWTAPHQTFLNRRRGEDRGRPPDVPGLRIVLPGSNKRIVSKRNVQIRNLLLRSFITDFMDYNLYTLDPEVEPRGVRQVRDPRTYDESALSRPTLSGIPRFSAAVGEHRS